MSKRSEALKNMRQQTLMKNMAQAPQQNNHDEPLVGILNAIPTSSSNQESIEIKNDDTVEKIETTEHSQTKEENSAVLNTQETNKENIPDKNSDESSIMEPASDKEVSKNVTISETNTLPNTSQVKEEQLVTVPSQTMIVGNADLTTGANYQINYSVPGQDIKTNNQPVPILADTETIKFEMIEDIFQTDSRFLKPTSVKIHKHLETFLRSQAYLNHQSIGVYLNYLILTDKKHSLEYGIDIDYTKPLPKVTEDTPIVVKYIRLIPECAEYVEYASAIRGVAKGTYIEHIVNIAYGAWKGKFSK